MGSKPGVKRGPYRTNGRINMARVTAVVEAIQRAPGKQPADYASAVGLTSWQVQCVLVNCEIVGHLLAEDERGRLVYLGRRP